MPKNEQRPLLTSQFPPVFAMDYRVGSFHAALETVPLAEGAHIRGFVMTLIIYLIWNKLTEAICAEDSGFFFLSRSRPCAVAKVKYPCSQHPWQNLEPTLRCTPRGGWERGSPTSSKERWQPERGQAGGGTRWGRTGPGS